MKLFYTRDVLLVCQEKLAAFATLPEDEKDHTCELTGRSAPAAEVSANCNCFSRHGEAFLRKLTIATVEALDRIRDPALRVGLYGSVRGVPALYRFNSTRTFDVLTVLSSGFHVLEDEVFRLYLHA